MIGEMHIGGRKCRLFGSEQPACILVQPSARHENATLEAEATQIAAQAPVPFVLSTVELEDWIVDLMPWPDGNISRDPEAGKHAQETLQYILMELVPELQQRFGPLPVILGGYSLGGLFALWAGTRTDAFPLLASVSGSLWYDGWCEYLEANPCRGQRVYLSLGEKEPKARNPRMARVGACTEKTEALLRASGVETTLEWNPGGHFKQPVRRTAKGIAWLLEP